VTDLTNVTMNPITLRFPPPLEKDFLEYYFRKSLKQIRVAMTLGASLFLAYGIVDMWARPDVFRKIWFIRYAVDGPVFLALLLLSLSPVFRRIVQPAFSFVILVAGLSTVVVLTISQYPAKYYAYAGIGQILMYAYAFTRLRFIYASIVSLVVSVTYIVAASIIGIPRGLVLLATAFLLTVNLVGMFASYYMEYYIRENYVQNRIVQLRTDELAAKNNELSNKNRELVQSREELLRSAKRIDLVFAALSEALPGTILDEKYEIAEKIGSGGFETVYRATHLILRHSVAIKVFRPSMGPDPAKSLERCRIEGISACRVHHRNAVTVLDFGVSAGIAYMVMELLQGRSLQEERNRLGLFSPARTLDILIPVCSVLAEAHASGIIHRDIKPANIFLHRSRDGETAKVVDFGVARLMADDSTLHSETLTEAGSIIGTPAYMSPERLTEKPYDGRADVYSVGVIMYEMLCGHLPFRSSDGNYWSLIMSQITQSPLSPKRINAAIPDALDALVLKALSKNPQNRPTAKQLEELLTELLPTLPRDLATDGPGGRQTGPGQTASGLSDTELIQTVESARETVAVKAISIDNAEDTNKRDEPLT
jgi:serine/threonine protein kinase